MPLPLLNIPRNWFKGTTIVEANWDTIKGPLENWASKLKLGLQQYSRDLFGAGYPINTDGLPALLKSNFTQIEGIKNNEIQTAPRRIGSIQNLGFRKFQTDDPDDSIALVGANGEDLSSSNKIQFIAKHASLPGVLEVKTIEVPLSLKLTDAHWGLDGSGDLTGGVIEISLIDDGGSVPALAAHTMPGRLLVSNTLCFTAHASVDAPDKVLVNRAIAAGNHPIYSIGFIRANYTDSVVPGVYGPVNARDDGSGILNNSSFGSVAWSNLNNATGSDNSYAQPANNSAATSQYLQAQAFLNIQSGADLPAGRIIRGIIIDIEKGKSSPTANITDAKVILAKNLGLGFNEEYGVDDKAKLGNWPEADAIFTYGSASDTWGIDWSNGVLLYVLIAAQTSNSLLSNARIDNIRFTIHYDVGKDTSWKITGLFPGRSSDGIWRPWNQISSDFNTLPSNGNYNWSVFGALTFIDYQMQTTGVSNSTTFELSLPVNALTISFRRPVGPSVNNGSVDADTARALVVGLVLSMERSNLAMGWSNTGGKNCRCQMFYFGVDS